MAERAESGRRRRSLEAELLRNVSHELRTPLTPILGHLDLARHGHLGPLTPELSEALEVIERCAQRLRRTVDALLDHSHLVSDRMRFRPRPFDAPTLLQVLLRECRPEAERRNQRLTLEMAPELPAVLGDPERVRQALAHLVDNAMKFTPSGGSVEVAARAAGCGVELAVRDTGIGMEPQLVESLFDSFRQGDGSLTRAHGGIGLGLAIAKAILAAHGAQIEVESRPGEGSVFRFVLAGVPPAADALPD